MTSNIIFRCWLLGMLCFSLFSLNAQSPCYQIILKKAQEYLEVGEYENAVYSFLAAGNCEDKPLINPLDIYTDNAVKAWTTTLDSLRKRAERGKATSDSLLVVADSLQVRANKGYRIIWSIFVAELALELVNNNPKDAYAAAYLAYDTLLAFNRENTRDHPNKIKAGHPDYTIRIPALVKRAYGNTLFAISKKEFGKHNGSIIKVKGISPGNDFFTIGRDSNFYLWKEDFSLRNSLYNNRGYFLSAAISDEGMLLTTSLKNAALSSFEGTQSQLLRPHEMAVTDGAFFADNQRIITISRDGAARIWSVDGNLIKTIFLGESLLELHLTPDRKMAAIRSGRKVFLIQLEEPYTTRTIDHGNSPIYDLALSPNGEFLLTASANNEARLWDIQDLSFKLMPHQSEVYLATFGQIGPYLLTITKSNITQLWQYNQGAELTVQKVYFSQDGDQISVTDSDIASTSNQINYKSNIRPKSVQFSPDKNVLLSVLEDGSAKLYLPQGEVLMSMQMNDGNIITHAIFSHSGKEIILTTQTGNLYQIPLPQVKDQRIILHDNKAPQVSDTLQELLKVF